MLQHTAATYYSALQHEHTPIRTHFSFVQVQHTATHYNVHGNTHCKTHCNTLQQDCNNAATHCNTTATPLQHTATHCNTNTLQPHALVLLAQVCIECQKVNTFYFTVWYFGSHTLHIECQKVIYFVLHSMIFLFSHPAYRVPGSHIHSTSQYEISVLTPYIIV